MHALFILFQYRAVARNVTGVAFNRNVWQKPVGFVLCCTQNVVKLVLTMLNYYLCCGDVDIDQLETYGY